MGISSVSTSVNIPSKYDLDGSKIYDVETGQTVFELETLTLEQLQKLYARLEKEKRALCRGHKIKHSKNSI